MTNSKFNVIRKRTETFDGTQMEFQFPSPTLSAYHNSNSNTHSNSYSPNHSSPYRSEKTPSSFNTDILLNVTSNKYQKHSSTNNTHSHGNTSPNSYGSYLTQRQQHHHYQQIPTRFDRFLLDESSPSTISKPKSKLSIEHSEHLEQSVHTMPSSHNHLNLTGTNVRNSREISDSMQSQATIFSTRGLNQSKGSLKRSKTTKNKSNLYKRLRTQLRKILKLFFANPNRLFKRNASIIRNSTITNNLSRENSLKRSGSKRVLSRSMSKRVISRSMNNGNKTSKLQRKNRSNPQNPLIQEILLQNEHPNIVSDNQKVNPPIVYERIRANQNGKLNHLEKYVDQQNQTFINNQNLKAIQLSSKEGSLSNQYTFKKYDNFSSVNVEDNDVDASEYSNQLANSFPSISSINNIIINNNDRHNNPKSLSQQRRYSKQMEQLQRQHIIENKKAQQQKMEPQSKNHTKTTSNGSNLSTEQLELLGLWNSYLKKVVSRRITMRREMNDIYTAQIQNQDVSNNSTIIKQENRNSVLSTMLDSDSDSCSSYSSNFSKGSRNVTRKTTMKTTSSSRYDNPQDLDTATVYSDITDQTDYGLSEAHYRTGQSAPSATGHSEVSNSTGSQSSGESGPTIPEHTLPISSNGSEYSYKSVKNHTLSLMSSKKGLPATPIVKPSAFEFQKIQTTPEELRPVAPKPMFDLQGRKLQYQGQSQGQGQFAQFQGQGQAQGHIQNRNSSPIYSHHVGTPSGKQAMNSRISPNRIREKQQHASLQQKTNLQKYPILQNPDNVSKHQSLQLGQDGKLRFNRSSMGSLREIGKSSGSLDLKSFIVESDDDDDDDLVEIGYIDRSADNTIILD